MSRLTEIISLANALRDGDAGAGMIAVDRETLGFLMKTLSAETAIIVFALALIAVFVFDAWKAGRKVREGKENETRRLREPDGQREPDDGSCAKIRRQLDEMIRKTNERNNYINSIFSSIEDGFLLVDGENDIVLYNPRASQLLGLGPEVFVDRREKSGVYPAELSAILEACAPVARTGEPRQLQLSDAGGRILDARVLPVANKYRRAECLGSLAIVRDVTEMRKLENMKKDFVATVSHEFRTPLTLISGFMEMFRTEEEIEPADRKRAFEILGIETERLKRLVSELLTLSEIENSLPGNAQETIDVGESIGTIAASLESLALKKEQRFFVSVDPRSGSIRGKADWFHQAVKNLVENAIKYTPAGGTIRIETRRGDGELRIAVEDTGIGIEESELEKIFERFYRIEKSRGSGSGGSGLGLALVKDICAISGGRVEVKSEPGAGSVFTLLFPAKTPGDTYSDRNSQRSE